MSEFPHRAISMLRTDTCFKFQRWRTLRNNLDRIIEMQNTEPFNEEEIKLVNKILDLAKSEQDHFITDVVGRLTKMWLKRRYSL